MLSPLSLDLTKQPDKATSIYLWADYIELLTLSDIDNEMSKADLLDRLKEAHDLSETDQNGDPKKSFDEEKFTIRAYDWFEQLQTRKNILNGRYPFTIEDDTCIANFYPESHLHNLYIFLLYCSNLRVVNKSQHTVLTSIFEMVSLEALKSYMPASASTHLFGANSKYESHYKGNLWQKISTLSKDMNEDLFCREEEITQSSGDKGLDVVSWLPFNDECQTKIIIFGQCAASPDEWTRKQHEAGINRWGNFFKFRSPLTSMIFIPFFYRNNQAKWVDANRLEGTMLIDRYRHIDLLTEYDFPVSIMDDIIEAISPLLQYKESIY